MSGYRGIEPVRAFEGEHHPLLRRQFYWTSIAPGIEVSLFAGKEMMILMTDACRAEDNGWSSGENVCSLTYLDMKHPRDFATADEAKAVAADFARAVLLMMLAHVGVREDDHSLQRCLLTGGQ